MSWTVTSQGNGLLFSCVPGIVAPGTPKTLDEVNLARAGNERLCSGFFSLDITFTGSGTLAATVLCSNGSSFVASEGAVAVITGKVAGHYLASFGIPICRAFKLTLTATTDTCTVTECIVAMA